MLEVPERVIRGQKTVRPQKEFVVASTIFVVESQPTIKFVGATKRVSLM